MLNYPKSFGSTLGVQKDQNKDGKKSVTTLYSNKRSLQKKESIIERND